MFRLSAYRTRQRAVLIALLGGLGSVLTAPADPPDGYYDSVETTDAATLRATLHEVIDDHTRIRYNTPDTWIVLELADQNPEDPERILDVYKNASYEKVGNGTGSYSREHTWPKSYGFPDNSGDDDNYPYSDCHMLFLCDKSYNSSRSNRPYRECHPACVEKPTEKNNGQGGGSGTYPGNSNWRTSAPREAIWETWIGRRGDVARALLYADIRYEGGTHGDTGASEPDLILTDDGDLIVTSSENEPVAYMGMLAVLLQWHEQDPVDDVERDRNDVVFSFQENRNPFIDNPEWVACLFLNECDAECPQDFDGDGDVDAADLAQVLGSWGPCEGCPADFNGDNDVDAADLAQLLGAWGLCP